MSSTSSPKSKAHGFSALSTAFGVALTLGVLGLVVAGALVVRDLKAAWLSSMAVEVVLNEEGGQSAEEWESLWAREPGVASVRFISAGEASAELEAELGEPFMDFLGQSPLPAMVELTLDPAWMSDAGVAGLAQAAERWEARSDVKRVAYPRRLLERLEDGFATWTVPALGLLTLLMVLVVAQILNVVRLSVFGRRHLIRSMELVGAPPFRIRRPFIGEAMGYGAVGVLLAYSAVVALLGALEPFLSVLGQWGPTELALVLGVQLSVGLLMTGLSARWAVGRYLGASLDKLV